MTNIQKHTMRLRYILADIRPETQQHLNHLEEQFRQAHFKFKDLWAKAVAADNLTEVSALDFTGFSARNPYLRDLLHWHKIQTRRGGKLTKAMAQAESRRATADALTKAVPAV